MVVVPKMVVVVVMARLTGLHPLSCHVRVDTDPGALPPTIQRERERKREVG